MLSDPNIAMTVFCPTDAAFEVFDTSVGMTYKDMLAVACPRYAEQVSSFYGRFYRLPWPQIIGRVFQAYLIKIWSFGIVHQMVRINNALH